MVSFISNLVRLALAHRDSGPLIPQPTKSWPGLEYYQRFRIPLCHSQALCHPPREPLFSLVKQTYCASL